MSDPYLYDEIKRKIRKLKKLELKIRFGDESLSGSPRPSVAVWDELFDLHAGNGKKAKYTLEMLASMSKEEYADVLTEFFFRVYDQFYKENGIQGVGLHDPEKLAQLGLPYDADMNAIKSRFRELAKEYHPDHGGDSEKFIELMKIYKGLMDQ